MLVGFDFPYSYPAGVAAALALGDDVPPWQALWREWGHLVSDDEQNRNQRFALAEKLNRRLAAGRGQGPFWGCPKSQAAGSGLPTTKPTATSFRERRLTDQRATTAQPVWKLCYPGSVGSQALLGIPRLQYLRRHPGLQRVSRVWPFEWDEDAEEALLDRKLLVVHAEIYPSLIRVQPQPGEAKDEVQVRELARFFAEKDAAGTLHDLLNVPMRLTEEERRRVIEEEGWILGVEA